MIPQGEGTIIFIFVWEKVILQSPNTLVRLKAADIILWQHSEGEKGTRQSYEEYRKMATKHLHYFHPSFEVYCQNAAFTFGNS